MTTLSSQPDICRLLVDHYAQRFGLTPTDVVTRMVQRFAAEDQILPEGDRSAEASVILSRYAEHYDRSPAHVLTGIIQQFVLGDVDFDRAGFQDFAAQSWGVLLSGDLSLAELERHAHQHAEATPRPRCPITGTVDTILPVEATEQTEIDRWFVDKVTDYRCPVGLGAPKQALRGIHARGLGTVSGTLTVMPSAHPPLPADAGRFGVFAEPGTHPLILRYSTSGGPRFESMPDDDPDQAVGLGLKVLRRTGETAHDLLFINAPTFMTHSPHSLVFAEDVSALRASYAATRTSRVTQALDETQYSVSAFSWGRGVAIKYALRPRQSARDMLPAELRDAYDALLEAGGPQSLSDALAMVVGHTSEPLSFALCVQFADPTHTPSHGCPTDDERVEWKTPWHTLAEVQIPPQRPVDGEVLSFTPFHVSDAGLLPLGRLNRSRQRAYAVSRHTRHQLNAVQQAPHPHRLPDNLRVAVVGGGASGLASALALARCGYAVTVFERSAQLGGHACVKDVMGGAHRREPAFGAFRQHQWPNLWALLEDLEVAPQSHGTAQDWFDSPFAGWFARDGHPIERSAETQEISRRVVLAFAKALRDPTTDGQTVGELFDELGVSDNYLMTSFVGGVVHYFAGHSLEHYLSYPARLMAWMWLNNAARADGESIELHRVDNETYMTRLAEQLQGMGVEIRTGVSATITRRDADGVCLSVDGTSSTFSEVILAIQPQHALTVLGDHATDEERDTLAAFEHTTGTVIVHQDETWMPQDRADWKLFNVVLPDADAPPLARTDTLPITIHKACARDGKTSLLATYDYGAADDWDGPCDRFTFEHLRVTPETQRLRQTLARLQGQHRVHFCGSWSRGLTLHEDAIVTGFEAANRILGPDRAHPILQPPVPLPTPFMAWVDPAASLLGGTRSQLLDQLREVLSTLQPDTSLDTLDEDAPLQGLVTSSLHLARLANTLSGRMPADAALDISTLLHLETVGELLDLLTESLSGASPHATDTVEDLVPLPPSAWGDRAHPVSLAQQSILSSHFRSGQASSQWNITLGRWMVGPLQTAHIRATLEALAERHTALRTRFEVDASGVYTQHIDEALPAGFFLEIPAASDAEARMIGKAVLDTPFDVTEGVIRARVIRTGPERLLLVMAIHHGVADGWSLGLLFRAFWSALPDVRAGRVPAALQGPPPAQQVDAARWEHAAPHRHDPAIAYWRERLARPLPSWPPARHMDQAPHMRTVSIAAGELAGLKSLARTWKTSLNVVLIAAYAQVLGRTEHLRGQQELIVRLPTAGRQIETEGIVGCFADAVLLRVPLHTADFAQAVQRVHECLYASLGHTAPLSLLNDALSLSPRELIDVNQVILNLEQGVTFLDLPTELGSDVTTEPVVAELRPRLDTAMFRSLLSLNEHPDGELRGEWFWSDDLVAPRTGPTVLVEALQTFLRGLLSDEDVEVPAAAPAPTGCPFHDVRRRVAQDARDVETLTGWYDEARDAPEDPDRDTHIGTLEGRFTASSAVDTAAGVFADDTPRPVRIRLSTRFGAGGMGLKIHDGEQTLHDLLLLTTTTMINDPVKLVGAAAGNQELGSLDVLFQPYYSISAYRWGEGAVRYRVQARAGQSAATLLPPALYARYTVLEDRTERLAMLLAHATQDVVLELAIQRATDPTLTPVDDTLVQWTTPFEPVAELVVPPQDLVTVHDDALRFHPFHVSDAAFLPLGRLNRIRREIYDHTMQDRTGAVLPYEVPPSLRIAVVGGGASGLQAALALADFGYQVTVYEAADTLGGHACVRDVLGGAHQREPAFGAFRAAQWPNLMVLLDTLGVQPVSHGQSAAWFDSPFVGWWRPDLQPVHPTPEVDDEARRFIGALHRVLADPAEDGRTVGELITELGLSDDFVTTWFIGGVVHYFAGHTLQYYLSYPARLMAWMWLNNAARSDGAAIELLRVDNEAYIAAFADLLTRKGVQIFTGARVSVTARDEDQVALSVTQDAHPDETTTFRDLVLAIQPHRSLEVLGAHASDAERELLGGFVHTVDVVQIEAEHPLTTRADHKLLNVMLPAADAPPSHGDTVPMVIIKSCARDGQTPIAATYDYAHTQGMESPEHAAFEHAQVTPKTQRLRRQLPALQGAQRVYFCGSWSRGLTLHEDALVSALQVVNQLVGPGRGVQIADPPVPLPDPFEALPQVAEHDRFGDSRAAVLDDLKQILHTVLEGNLPPDLQASTNLQDIQLSSLHFARLANAVSSRLPPEQQGEVDIVLLLQMDTLGELADHLHGCLHPDDASVEDPPEPVPVLPGRRDHVATLPEPSEGRWPMPAVLILQLTAILALGATVLLCGAAAAKLLSLGTSLGTVGALVSAPLAYALALGLYTLIAVGVKRAVVGTLRPGRYPVYGTTHLRWWVGDLFLRLGQHTVWSPLAETPLAPWLLTTLGGHVDPTATAPVGGRLTSISAIDADLLDIGADAHIRRTARVRAHMFLDGELVLSPVTVRDGGVVWSRALVEPGARVSQGAMLDAHAVLVMGHEVPEDTTWSGIPASAAQARPGPAPLKVDPQERRATLLCGLVLVPSVAMAAALSWWGVITAMIPGVSLSSPDIRVWLAAYPAWLLVTWLGALGVVCVKWAALGRLEPGTAEDDHPVALPLVRALTGMVALVSPLWPSALRWGYASVLGARVSPHAITEEPFLDLAYADLYTRASGSFFSPAAFAEFAHPEDGRRVLQPIELVQGSYVGAYSTVVAPLQTQPQSMLAGCSHLPAGEEMTGSAAWVGVPARAVPIRPGEATQDAFRVPHKHLRAVRWLTDLLRIAVFLVGMGIVWAAGRVASGGGFVAGLAGLGTLLAATWAIFVPLLWLQGREIKRQLREDPVLERDGIARQSPLFAVWASTLLTMLPVALTTDMLSGTPLRSVLLRLLGARIGARVYVDQGVALSELPFIDIADDAVINEGAALIAHSEQPDGRVSFKTLHLGAQSSVLWSGYLVGGTHLPDRAVLGSLSRPFDGQQLEADREYDNTPCRAQDGG